jgi:hypothetical protein
VVRSWQPSAIKGPVDSRGGCRAKGALHGALAQYWATVHLSFGRCLPLSIQGSNLVK